MECDRVLELIPLHAGGDLTPDEAVEVDRHVAACSRCEAEVAAFRASIEAFKAGSRSELPADACDGLWEGVRRGLAAERRIRRPIWGSPMLRWTAAAAVFAVGILGGIVATRSVERAAEPNGDIAHAPKPPSERHAAELSVPARTAAPRTFDLRSVAIPVSDRGSMLEVIPADGSSRSYRLDDLRVIRESDVSLGY